MEKKIGSSCFTQVMFRGGLITGAQLAVVGKKDNDNYNEMNINKFMEWFREITFV
jgi:hypothetical protein